ncbi:MAG: SMC-Scp complex subunit ScpB [Pseudomonadota bacterium]
MSASPEPGPDASVGAQLFDTLPLSEQECMLEAVLFAAEEPLRLSELTARLPEGCDVPAALEGLRERYADRGVRLVQAGNAWAFRTAPELGFLLRRERVQERPLSRAAIETLAIIAYHQPVTRAEIEETRGVAVSRGTLDLLLELDWIRIGKRRETPGRPATFVTTTAFLDHFGLTTVRDLPGLKELRQAGLLDPEPPLTEVPPDEDLAEEPDAEPEARD